MTQVLASQNLAELTMDNFWEFYESGEMDSSVDLLRKLGHSSLTLDYVFSPDSYYYPNRRGNVFVKPQNIDDDRIPVLVMDNDREFLLPSPPSVHQRQKEILLESGCPGTEIDEIDVIFRSYGHGKWARPSEKTVRASTLVGMIRFPRDVPNPERSMLYGSTPNLIFYSREDRVDNSICPSTPFHELAHVAQHLDRPRATEHKLVDMELQAYAAQARLTRSLLTGSSPLARATQVDSYRKNNLGKDVYTATPEFEKVARQDPVMRRVLHLVDYNSLSPASV